MARHRTTSNGFNWKNRTVTSITNNTLAARKGDVKKMMLSYNELLEQVRMGTIDNLSVDQINGSSIDVRLGPTVMVEKYVEPGECTHGTNVVNLMEKESVPLVSYTMPEDGMVLAPGQAILAETMEIFNLPSYITADFRLKSSVGRSFLEQLHSCHCDPCWHGSVLTLQLVNLCQHNSLLIGPGMKIGQIILHQHAPVPDTQSYAARGQYNNTKTVTSSKGIK